MIIVWVLTAIFYYHVLTPLLCTSGLDLLLVQLLKYLMKAFNFGFSGILMFDFLLLL